MALLRSDVINKELLEQVIKKKEVTITVVDIQGVRASSEHWL